MSLYVEVVLPLPLTQSFTYLAPEAWESSLQPGMRVLVPFGERVLTAFVVALGKKKPETEVELKEIHEVLDERPLLSPLFLSFTRKLSGYYYSSWGELLQASLPPSFLIRSRTSVFLSEKGREALTQEEISEDERMLLSLVQKRGYTPVFIRKKLGLKYSSSLLSRLERKGFIRLEREVRRTKRREARTGVQEESQLEIDFSLDREAKELARRIFDDSGKKGVLPFLLFGPRERREAVYLQAIRDVLARKQRAVFLVPEVSLTKYPLERMKERLGAEVALLHSQMPEKRREDEWRKVREGAVEVVLGSRAALFSQVRDIGLIIVDDEHDDSYCQMESPSYDVRKGAWLRAEAERAFLVYGSLEPTVDSFYRAGKAGTLLSMRCHEERKKVTVLAEKRRGAAVNESLRNRIGERLAEGEQVIIFINRRGYAPLVICSQCSYIPRCRSCNSALTYHRKEERLLCHSCGFSLPRMEVCPECRGRILRMVGVGIEAVEEELRRLFPDAGVASLASDEARTRKDRERVILDFSRGKIDILLGTQLLAHQGDLPPVVLVGILYPEILLGFSDYRASQKTYQSIRQMMAFCCDESQAEVVIQTALPSHFSIQAAAANDYLSFYDQEIAFRRLMNYPPFSRIIGVSFQGRKARALARESREFRALASRSGEVEVLGPSLLPSRRSKGGSSIQFFLKARRENVLDRVLRESFRGSSKFRGSIVRFWG